MFDVGGGELLLILLAVIVLFGPKKIPEIVQMFGKGLSQFRKAQSELKSHLDDIKSEVTSQIKSVENVVEEKPKQQGSQIRQTLPLDDAEPMPEPKETADETEESNKSDKNI